MDYTMKQEQLHQYNMHMAINGVQAVAAVPTTTTITVVSGINKKQKNGKRDMVSVMQHGTRKPSNVKRNERERKRVKTINDFFDRLQRLLPSNPKTMNKKNKLSKVETLKITIDYLQSLKSVSDNGPHQSVLTSPSSSCHSSPEYTDSYSNRPSISSSIVSCSSSSSSSPYTTPVKNEYDSMYTKPCNVDMYQTNSSSYQYQQQHIPMYQQQYNQVRYDQIDNVKIELLTATPPPSTQSRSPYHQQPKLLQHSPTTYHQYDQNYMNSNYSRQYENFSQSQSDFI